VEQTGRDARQLYRLLALPQAVETLEDSIMARRRKKGALLNPSLLSADDIASAVEELTTALLGRSPLGKLASKVAGRIVFRQVGGKPQRAASKPKTLPKQPKVKVIQLDNGVEYYPPPRSKP
jgi:hypothetical protein